MNYKFTAHAFTRMAARAISPQEVVQDLKEGTIIKEYPDDEPNPSRLIMATVNDRPIHVVAAYEKEIDAEIIITAYVSDGNIWTNSFKERR